MNKLYTYDISSILNGRPRAVYTGSKWTETMFIWWCHGYQSHIYVNDSTPKQVGNFAQEYGNRVSSAFIDRFPGIGSKKKGVWSEDSCKLNQKLTTRLQHYKKILQYMNKVSFLNKLGLLYSQLIFY